MVVGVHYLTTADRPGPVRTVVASASFAYHLHLLRQIQLLDFLNANDFDLLNNDECMINTEKLNHTLCIIIMIIFLTRTFLKKVY